MNMEQDEWKQAVLYYKQQVVEDADWISLDDIVFPLLKLYRKQYSEMDLVADEVLKEQIRNRITESYEYQYEVTANQKRLCRLTEEEVQRNAYHKLLEERFGGVTTPYGYFLECMNVLKWKGNHYIDMVETPEKYPMDIEACDLIFQQNFMERESYVRVMRALDMGVKYGQRIMDVSGIAATYFDPDDLEIQFGDTEVMPLPSRNLVEYPKKYKRHDGSSLAPSKRQLDYQKQKILCFYK